MLVVPAATAVITPVPSSTVAIEVFVLLQLPPPVPLLVYVVVAPMQSGVVPLTVPAAGLELTVSFLNALTGLHPVLTV